MAETSYAIPVYRGWPEKHYKVLGSVRFEDSRKNWDDGIIAMAARAGKRNGGDAIIIRQGAEFGVSKITGVANPQMTLSQNQTTAFVIQWMTPQETKKAEDQKAEFFSRYEIEYPNVKANEAVKDMVFHYLLREGTPYTKEMTDSFVKALEDIAKTKGSNLSGTWAYKGTLNTSSITSFGDEDVLLGLATVKADGENIVIVSNTGKVEVNFNGSHVKGRIQGQIGISSFTSKAEGAALDNKISVSFQSATPDGTVRGNLVFQR